MNFFELKKFKDLVINEFTAIELSHKKIIEQLQENNYEIVEMRKEIAFLRKKVEKNQSKAESKGGLR